MQPTAESMFDNLTQDKFWAFIEINALINSRYANTQVLLRTILESAMRLCESEAASLLLLEQDSKKLRFEIALGPKGEAVEPLLLQSDAGIAGWVAKNALSAIVNDVDQDPRWDSTISSAIGFPTFSILAVPLCIKENLVGVIEVINKRDKKYFTAADQQWIEVFATQAALAIENARYLNIAENRIQYLQDKLTSDENWHALIVESPVMREKLDMIDKIAKTNSTVLILGESGVGKELIAERIHVRSSRNTKPFVRVNCAALPETLLETELFGHIKGAFTDATSNRMGRFELAQNGTIFLDEIGDLPEKVQAKLLRVLQEKTFEPVGSSKSITIDVRIIAATNANIEEKVENGTFRSDLFYRLNVLPVMIPPLRQRKEDITAIGKYYLSKIGEDMGKKIDGFAEDAIHSMLTYSWPGNIRELANCIERAMVFCRTPLITASDLQLGVENDRDSYKGQNLKDALNAFKRFFILQTLEENNWNQTETAKALEIQRTYLSKLIREFAIERSKE